jgi:F1F0 ATPase subunit 2
MNESLIITAVFIAGIALGILFFGGLWLTVKKTINSPMPAFWILGSFLLRVGITLIGFYYIATGSVQRLLICVLGFITGRFIITRFTKLNKDKQMQLTEEVNHET